MSGIFYRATAKRTIEREDKSTENVAFDISAMLETDQQGDCGRYHNVMFGVNSTVTPLSYSVEQEQIPHTYINASHIAVSESPCHLFCQAFVIVNPSRRTDTVIWLIEKVKRTERVMTKTFIPGN